MADQNPRLHHLRKIRMEELSKIIPLLSPTCSVLEIGGGAGWQAKMLSEQGYDVTVIEIAEGSLLRIARMGCSSLRWLSHSVSES